MAAKVPPMPNLAGGQPADAGQFLLARRLRACRHWLTDQRNTLLDFGCGNGAQTLHFAPEFSQTYGVDVNSDFLDAFERRLKTLGDPPQIKILPYDGMHLPLDDQSMDQVISFTVLEHVTDEAAALQEIWRVLKPGGRMLLSVPNKWWIFETHGCDLPILPWNRVPLVSWWPKVLHDRYARARIYRRRDIKDLVAGNGFEIQAVQRLTAPLDMLTIGPLKDLCRKTLFRNDLTSVPFLATEILLIADKVGCS